MDSNQTELWISFRQLFSLMTKKRRCCCTIWIVASCSTVKTSLCCTVNDCADDQNLCDLFAFNLWNFDEKKLFIPEDNIFNEKDVDDIQSIHNSNHCKCPIGLYKFLTFLNF